MRAHSFRQHSGTLSRTLVSLSDRREVASSLVPGFLLAGSVSLLPTPLALLMNADVVCGPATLVRTAVLWSLFRAWPCVWGALNPVFRFALFLIWSESKIKGTLENKIDVYFSGGFLWSLCLELYYTFLSHMFFFKENWTLPLTETEYILLFKIYLVSRKVLVLSHFLFAWKIFSYWKISVICIVTLLGVAVWCYLLDLFPFRGSLSKVDPRIKQLSIMWSQMAWNSAKDFAMCLCALALSGILSQMLEGPCPNACLIVSSIIARSLLSLSRSSARATIKLMGAYRSQKSTFYQAETFLRLLFCFHHCLKNENDS